MCNEQLEVTKTLDDTHLDQTTGPVYSHRHRHVTTYQERPNRISERVLHVLVADPMTPL